MNTPSREISTAMSAGASMSAALSSGAPSATYAKSIGASRAHADVIIPALPEFADNARKNREDRLTGSCGGTELASRLERVKPFEPKMLTCVIPLNDARKLSLRRTRWRALAGARALGDAFTQSHAHVPTPAPHPHTRTTPFPFFFARAPPLTAARRSGSVPGRAPSSSTAPTRPRPCARRPRSLAPSSRTNYAQPSTRQPWGHPAGRRTTSRTLR